MKIIETQYDGRRFRSRTEARWAVFFNTLGFEYEYEREGVDLDGEWYLPDFYLPAFPMWVEVKGERPTDREIELAKRLSKASGKRVLIAVGAPAPEAAQFLRFDDGRRVGGDWMFMADRRNEGEYWLVTGCVPDVSYDEDYMALSIGPVDGPQHDREPLVHGRLEEAFNTARAARFEHGERG